MTKILAVDDNEDALFALEHLLREEGYDVVTAANGNEALRRVQEDQPELVLLDVVMPGPSGFEVVEAIKADPELRFTTVVLLTSKSDMEDVLQGLSRGADDYIKKPYSRDELLARISAAMRTRKIYQELRETERARSELERRVVERYSFANIVGKSDSMRAVFDLIEKVKDSELPVLITGESGTGKELVASAIHYSGRRHARSLVVQNCSAFNENLLESELFGHVKGAFSGALRDKQGLFEVADGGSFFLDELGEMSLALQARLLRVLEDGTFIPVGATRPRKVDVRIIAATNRNLEEMVGKGAFRQDLYYRLNVINIKLPALRERREDIPLLVEHLLDNIAARGGGRKRLQSEALQLLCDYRWPGNIRELRNEIERAALLSGGAEEIGVETLSAQIQSRSQQGNEAAPPVGELPEAVAKLEREMILAALERLAWNKSEAARSLGISRSSLIAKVQAYGLEQGDAHLNTKR